ncbi:hypothetical protein OXPF_18680 [Oxobacter pfennigii]|uniref:Threonine/Serine exporter ThrE domain-containing protein n=1 Tax=Oxobacter pfennigii TaxID=36849 RepID=A0A0P8YYE1_9CLOT|nr:threonine/serine exporter family protein [Oxobacter pfennigii]KPU44782.1 hypothetical protein OXPF_18680 [Oxobacter pfennigii]
MVRQVILAFFGSIFPVILFNIDRKKLIWNGLCGALAWTVYLLSFELTKNTVMSSFMGAFTVGIYSETMARKLKTPAMEFSIAGIFPLVPGMTAYKTITYIVEQNFIQAFAFGIQTLAVAGAVGFGIMLVATVFRFFSRVVKE